MRPTAQNIVLGAGYLFFDIEDENGNLTGERYLGDTPGFSLNVTSENLQVMSSDGPVAEPLADIATQITRSAQITARNIDGANLAAFIIGDVGEATQSSGTVADEKITVQPGRWYQLGATASNPIGARNVSAVTVKKGTSPTFVKGDDYDLDEALGRIYIIPSGDIEADDELTIGYTKSALTFEQVVSNNLGAKTGALRYIADNTEGINRDMYIPKATLRPSGELPTKSRTEPQQMVFEVGIGTREGLPQLYINGRPAA